MRRSVYFSKQIQKILSKIEKHGEEAYLIGGCVRDAFLGISPQDFDITTSATPEQIKEIFRGEKIIETGIKHGTVTVLYEGTEAEITTFRTEAGYSDGRRPDSVSFTSSLFDDTSRRDFTINAIAYNDNTGPVDFHGGIQDIKNKIIRCVGIPEKRFGEDALRILRAIRFASVLDFDIEKRTSDAIHSMSELLYKISAERIASEFSKLICGKAAKKILLEYSDVISVIIPELIPSIGFDQKNYHHIYDVYTHSVVALDYVRPCITLRLSALLHDCGKPACFTVDENGVGHFSGHPEVSAELSDTILRRLKFDNETRNLIVTLIKNHDRQIEATEKAVKRAMGKLTPEVFFLLIELKRADNMAQAPQYRQRLLLCDRLEQTANKILKDKECIDRKSLAVNGHDLINIGIKDGKTIGLILEALLDEVIEQKIENQRSPLLDRAVQISKNLDKDYRTQ
jgi:hypothetical protein